MSSSLQVFSSENFSVRTIQDEDSTIWFVGKDILEALGY